ncbi:pancreatic lipase-related protein 2-like [Brevipalpus obovatus]|uniref:pancreatic lipase-related protein 2-like n=1 Tax=Brevipalpus obovatus TaxID=246614 RepID=UPI003D9F999D
MITLWILFSFLVSLAGCSNVEKIKPENTKKSPKTDVCYGKYGCFTKLDFFDPVSRAFISPPSHPEKINVSFHVFTAKNALHPFVMNYKEPITRLEESPFDPEWPIKIIIHGWVNEFKTDEWTGRLVHTLVQKNTNVNAIAVNWRGGSMRANYLQAAADVRLVGRIVANFLREIEIEYGISPHQVHIIGHSLGAHVSGFAGKEFKNPKIGHITALDPAGPYFGYDDEKRRLDKNDAWFVEVIHTNMGVTGINKKIGHVNVYPNGGAKQPGCSTGDQIRDGVGWVKSLLSGCSHSRANQLMLEPFESKSCQPVAYACSSYEDFKKGKCTDCGKDNENCWLFGLKSKHLQSLPARYGLQYYLMTDSKSPFCLNHFAITVFTTDKQETTGGLIRIDLNYASKKVAKLVIKEGNFRASSEYARILTSRDEGNREPVKSLTIRWEAEGFARFGNMIGFKHKSLYVDRVEITLMSLWSSLYRRAEAQSFCNDNSQIETNKMITLRPCLTPFD